MVRAKLFWQGINKSQFFFDLPSVFKVLLHSRASSAVTHQTGTSYSTHTQSEVTRGAALSVQEEIWFQTSTSPSPSRRSWALSWVSWCFFSPVVVSDVWQECTGSVLSVGNSLPGEEGCGYTHQSCFVDCWLAAGLCIPACLFPFLQNSPGSVLNSSVYFVKDLLNIK